MSLPITEREIEAYRKYARRRWEQEQYALRQRKAKAWELARQAALVLKEQFGASRVAVFGSLLHERGFHSRSDIDLVVWGLPEKDYFRALGKLLSLDPDFEFDLLEFENTSPRLQAAITREAIEV